MMRNTIILLFLAITSLSGLSNLNAQTVYTVDEAIRTALSNNQETKIAVKEVDRAKAAVDQAFGYALPNVNFSSSYSRFLSKPKTPFPDFGALFGNMTYDLLFKEKLLQYDESKFKPMASSLQSFAQTNNFEAKAEITQTLFSSAVFRGIGASEIYLETSKLSLKANISKTILNVKKAFHTVLLTKSLYEITKSSLENGEKNLSNVRALKSQGLVSEYDALQAEVQVENIRPMVLQMENNLKMAKEGLRIAMGISGNDDFDVNGELVFAEEQFPEIDKIQNTAFESNWDIRSLESKAQIDKEMIELDRSEYWPTIAAFGNYTYSGSSNNFNFQTYSSSIIGLSLSINLFSGMQTKAKVQQSTINAEKTIDQLSMLKNSVAMQIKNQINEINRIKINIKAQERNISLAQKGYELATLRYKEGTGNQLEIQNADLSLRQAKTNLIQSYHEYMNSKAELDALTGNINSEYILIFSNRLDK